MTAPPPEPLKVAITTKSSEFLDGPRRAAVEKDKGRDGIDLCRIFLAVID